MGYQVLIENLEAAAKSLRTTVKGMGDYDFGETNVSGASFGHVELRVGSRGEVGWSA